MSLAKLQVFASHPVCESHVPFGATIRYLLMFVHRRDAE